MFSSLKVLSLSLYLLSNFSKEQKKISTHQKGKGRNEIHKKNEIVT
ncbi:hypothetical protein EVA_02747 [gut metagenome]|uniref:Uncharacterized protein n=1 Tax=gut metagenome TaxID=749906 RepID=J9H0J4_9ZZZZ